MGAIRELEVRREAILAEMRSLRSMKRGSVNEQYLKVRHKGKREPVLRGPYFVSSRSEGGKTVSRRLTSPEEIAQARQASAQYQRFRQLCHEFQVVTERLAELQPSGAQESPEKKTAQIAVEQSREVNWILERAAQACHVDLEALETAVRSAVLQAGSRALQTLLDGIGSGRQDAPMLCRCGARMESHGREDKELLSMLGPLAYRRSRYVCPSCGESRYPGDEALDIVGTTRSPGVRRLMARAGSKTPFKEASEDLLVYAGLSVSAKDVERVAEQTGEAMQAWNQQERTEVLARPPLPTSQPPVPILYISYDGTGIPMTRRELAGRRGKQPDGSARTREAKPRKNRPETMQNGLRLYPNHRGCRGSPGARPRLHQLRGRD